MQVVFSCCWNAADLVLTPPQMYRRRPLLTVANGTLMARRSWPSMGRCRQLAARRRPPGQGSPAPAGGGAPHSELFEHATRSAAARARLVRQDEHPRKAQRVRHAPGASRRRRLRWSPLRQHHVSVRSFGCTGGFRRSNERRRGSNQCSRRKTSQSRPESRFHDVAPVTRQCSERTLAGKISKNYPCDPSAKVRPDAGSHPLVKVRLAGGRREAWRRHKPPPAPGRGPRRRRRWRAARAREPRQRRLALLPGAHRGRRHPG